MGADVVVVGAGPNGLVAANLLADAGLGVVVLEAQDTPGGAVRTEELACPGYRSDVFSSFYPLGAASPVIRGLGLEDHGLRWRHAPAALAHPTPDGRCALLSRDVEATAASLAEYAPGDADVWRQVHTEFERVGPRVVELLLGPFPPVLPALRAAAAIGPGRMLAFARGLLAPARRLGEATFEGDGGRLLLAGNAGHTDLSPEAMPSGVFGWLLTGLGGTVGFPVVEGGAGRLTDALVSRLADRGGEVRCGCRVTAVEVTGGRASAVLTADGERVTAAAGVVADVSAPALYLDLLPAAAVPAAVRRDLEGYEWDAATVKVDWALRAPIPWSDERVRTAGTVHLADSVDDLSRAAAETAAGDIPSTGLVVLGQYAAADPSRFPPGGEAAWAYTHVPHRSRRGRTLTAGEVAEVVAGMEARIEARAPGFADLVVGRHCLGPAAMEARDANLVDGALNGGTAALHHQVVFRPSPHAPGPATPVGRLYLGSASAHPGGGVHGACGANAARALLRDLRRGRRRALGAAGVVAAGAGAVSRARRPAGGRSGPARRGA